MGFSPSPAYVQTYTATPTGRSSSTLVALGLASVITPQVTGRVLVMVSGTVQVGTSTDGAGYNLYYGTTGTPSNNDPVSGTAICTLQQVPSLVASDLRVPFALQGTVTGLAVPGVNSLGVTGAAVPVWFDIMFEYVTGANTVTFFGVSCTLIEF